MQIVNVRSLRYVTDKNYKAEGAFAKKGKGPNAVRRYRVMNGSDPEVEGCGCSGICCWTISCGGAASPCDFVVSC